MALFKILRGSKKNLPSNKTTNGYMYITENTGDIYVDLKDGTDINNNRIQLNANYANYLRDTSPEKNEMAMCSE